MMENTATRPKVWSELSADEKAERNREVLKRVQRDLKKIDKMMREFYAHQHSQNGTVLTQAKPPSYGDDEMERPVGGDVWF